jgi:DNA-binding CsgD family transcriptional regulator
VSYRPPAHAAPAGRSGAMGGGPRPVAALPGSASRTNPVRTIWPRRAETDLIGRTEELAALVECVLGALSGSPRFVLLEGPPAAGKSILLSAAAEAAATAGARVLRAWGNAAESDLPFGVAGQLFELALDGASDEEHRAWLRGPAGAVARILNVDGRGVPASGEGLAGHAASHALYWLTANAARHVPLVLVVDDLQWADADSLRWLIYLSRRLKRLPLVVVAALSPDVPKSTSSFMALLGAGVERLPLSGLDAATVARLIAELTGTQPAASLAARLVAETGGLPLLLRNLLEASLESPVASVTADSPPAGTPEFGRTVLMRLSQPGPDKARLAIAVATLVRGDLDTAASVAGLPLPEATAAAATLSRLDVLTLGDQIAFRHNLVRRALLAAVPEAERAEYEVRAARARHEHCAPVAIVADHLVRTARPVGEDWAVTTLWSSAEEAIRQGATDRALVALRRLLAEPHQPPARARYLAELGALEVYQSPAAAMEHLGIALPRLEEPRLVAAAAGRLASALLDSAAAAEAVGVLSAQRQRLTALDPERADQLELQRMTVVSWARAYCHEVATGLDGLVERVRSRGPTPRLEPLADALLAFRLCGEARHLQQVRRLATTALDGTTAKDDLGENDLGENEKIVAFGSAAAALLNVGSYGLVAEHAGRQMELADGQGLQLLAAWSRALLAAAQLGLHQHEQAAASATAALQAAVCAHGGQHRLPTVLATAVLADCHAELGQHQDGMTILTRAGLDGEVPKLWIYDHVLRSRGRLRLAAGDAAGALADLLRLGQRGTHRDDGRSASLSWRPLAALAHAALGQPDKAATLTKEQVALARVAATPLTLAEALLTHGVILQRRQPIREAVSLLVQPGAALSDDPLSQALELLREHGSQLLASQLEQVARSAALPANQFGTATRPSVAGHTRSPAFGPDALTPHERRLIAMAVAGQTNDAIAQVFGVSRRAVEFHFTHIYRKLGINGRIQLQQFSDMSAP